MIDDSHEKLKRHWIEEDRIDRAGDKVTRIKAAAALAAQESDFETWWQIHGRMTRASKDDWHQEGFRRRFAKMAWDAGQLSGQDQ